MGDFKVPSSNPCLEARLRIQKHSALSRSCGGCLSIFCVGPEIS